MNTNWGTDLPFVVRLLVRVLQPLLGRSISNCAELLSVPLLKKDDELKSSQRNFLLINQYGEANVKTTDLHETARDVVWRDTMQLLTRVGLEQKQNS